LSEVHVGRKGLLQDGEEFANSVARSISVCRGFAIYLLSGCSIGFSSRGEFQEREWYSYAIVWARQCWM